MLNLYLQMDEYLYNGDLENSTLEQLNGKYGELNLVRQDIKTIEKGIEELKKMKEEFVALEEKINNKINYFSQMDSKFILKINEHTKKNKYDYYKIRIDVYKVNSDATILIDRVDADEFLFSQRAKVFNFNLQRMLEKYDIKEIYSNKEIKNHSYKPLEELKIE